ncbi:hypothetical protein ACFXPM_35605 [Streptomyces sp. NPDC059095]|uniref:hypothetical protein n=1 Tax=Streptomyces sp. NPDC059095 TaxID=3346726 RepID=UPI0036C5FD10
MLYAFGFEQLGVVVSDLYFVDPDPLPGQETAERGVRLELRIFEPGELTGTIYAARPISIGRPLWRVDLLQDADAPPHTLDRAHHHPNFDGWDPGSRVFVPELSGDPLSWLSRHLADPGGVLKEAGTSLGEISASDMDALRAATPEIVDTVRRLLDRVWSGELGRPTENTAASGVVTSMRVSWL